MSELPKTAFITKVNMIALLMLVTLILVGITVVYLSNPYVNLANSITAVKPTIELIIKAGSTAMLLLFGTHYIKNRFIDKRLLTKKVEEVPKKITKNEVYRDSTFIESISHEIRTPLNGIIGYAEYIKHTSQESMIQFPAQIIHESSQQLLKLIDNLTDLAEIETQRKIISTNAFKLNSIIDELCKSHLTQTSKKKIELRYEYDPQCPEIVILDESLFKKVISNLLENALIFSKDLGEIVLSIHYLKSINSLYISIKDNGHGIPENMHSHVFDKFWDSKSFISSVHGGSLLGLALTKKMIELMGGEINFNSSENVGSIFYFTIPIQKIGSEF